MAKGERASKNQKLQLADPEPRRSFHSSASVAGFSVKYTLSSSFFAPFSPLQAPYVFGSSLPGQLAASQLWRLAPPPSSPHKHAAPPFLTFLGLFLCLVPLLFLFLLLTPQQFCLLPHLSPDLSLSLFLLSFAFLRSNTSRCVRY